VRKVDVAAMFVSLWLLATMVIDVVTPKELSVYTIGATLAPAFVVLAVLYWKRVSRFEFAAAFATLWMVIWIVLTLLASRPLSLLLVIVAVVPLLVVGAVFQFQRQRRSKSESGSTPFRPEPAESESKKRRPPYSRSGR
jgi:uncharacterized membrane protein